MFLRPLIPLVLALLLPAQAGAQLIRGQLLNGETGLPLEGAMVLLLQDGATEVGAVLSNASGRFLLRAPAPGSYVVRADRIGHASTSSDLLALALGDTVELQMVAQVRAIQLEGLEVRGEARCDIRPQAGRAVATVWEEARKALAAAALTEDTGIYRYRTIRYLRELEKDGLRVISEERRASQAYLAAPFESLPAETFLAQGFMKADPKGDLYYAPDARVLLSDPFLDTHCLGLTTGQGDSADLLGVTFAPITGRELPEIRGIVWVEPATGRLRHVDYTYENLDPALRSEAVGGRVVFQGLPNGSWIVTEWRIRMPNAAFSSDFRGGRQLILAGIREVGGEVDRIQTPSGETILEAERATLEGVVLDSTGLVPLAGARVEVLGTQATAITDQDGAFRIPGLRGGVFDVDFTHPTLPELGGSEQRAEVRLTPGKISSVQLVAEPLSRILAAACGEEARPEGSAVLTGKILDGETGAPLAGAELRVLWTDYRFHGTHVASGAGRWQTLMGMQEDGLQGETDDTGRYVACVVPADHPIRVEAAAGLLASGSTPLRIPPGSPFFTLDLSVARSEAGGPEGGVGSVQGIVVDFQDQRPLEGVQVRLTDLDRGAVTGRDGRFAFPQVPLGRHIIATNILGRGPLVDTVQVRPDRPLHLELRLPTEALELEGISVEVISQREMDFRREGFSGGRTDFITPEEMELIRDRVTNVVDVIRTMGSPRVRISDTSTGGVPMGFCIRWTRRELSVYGGGGQGAAEGCSAMLVVVDGIPQQNVGGAGPTIPATDFLLDLTPEDLESVRVLSPTQARFEYGSRGGRGALIIKTRRGGGG